MIKTNLLVIILILLTACGGNVPKTTEDALSDITITKDTFNNSTTIETPLYLSRAGLTDPFPVKLKFNAFYTGEKQQFIQLYVTVTDVEWSFYHSANGEDGKSLELIKIDNVIDPNGIVVVEEHVGLRLPIDYLIGMADKDFKIKLFGKRKSGVFTVKSNLTKAFILKLNCFEAKTCN